MVYRQERKRPTMYDWYLSAFSLKSVALYGYEVFSCSVLFTYIQTQEIVCPSILSVVGLS